MIDPKEKKNPTFNSEEDTLDNFTEDDFLRVLDRAISPPEPPDLEIDETSE